MTEYVLVPKEPTPQMIDAAFGTRESVDASENSRATWAAMLAAAPSPSLPVQVEEFVERLQENVKDPMWADHVEMSKRRLHIIIGFIRQQAAEIERVTREANDLRGRLSNHNRRPDVMASPQAEAIRAGYFDDTSFRELFDKMEQELKLHRERAEELSKAEEEIGRVRREALDEAAKMADANDYWDEEWDSLDQNTAFGRNIASKSIAAAIRALGKDGA